MGDWKFGDVLALTNTPHPVRVMFVSRKNPVLWQGRHREPKFWGFEGIYLAPDCVGPAGPESKGGCGFGHFTGQPGSFGGHPETEYNSSWNNDWKIDIEGELG